MSEYDVVDLYAGAGGWSQAVKALGLTEIGMEWNKDACATAEAAGHKRLQGDLAALDPKAYKGAKGLIASPPCQTFSLAGKGAGRAHLAKFAEAAALVGQGKSPKEAIAEVQDEVLDDRSVHVLEPLRWARDMEPEWVALEQVPTALPVWQAIGEALKGLGYSVWTGVLVAADYGTPQSRKRAILTASRTKVVAQPTPTHSKTGDPDTLYPLPKWVSMAQALGWDKPKELVPGTWAANGGNRRTYTTDEVAPTLCFGHDAAGWKWKVVDESGEPVETDTLPDWVSERPSTTIVGSFRPEIVAAPGYRKAGDPPRQKTPGSVQVTISEAGVLQGFPAAYPWSGSKGSTFLQCGNAIPVQLAAAILRSVV